MNNGKICVSVCAETADEMIANIKSAEEFADVIEVRFDCLRSDEVEPLEALINNSGHRSLIATYRSHVQGGNNFASLDDRIQFWRMTKEQFWAADVEEDVFLFAGGWRKRIGSFHDFNETPDNLDLVYERLLSSGADVIKISAQANDISDSVAVWRLLERAKADRKNIIPIAMGEAGKWTRILGLAHGSYITYASLDEGLETADGQIAVKDLIETYRVKELDLNTKVFGVMGDPVSESLSPFMHNPAFLAKNINAVFIPLQIRDLGEFIHRMVIPETREVELNFAGFAVTMPHKQAIIKHLDAIDTPAETIGAVNTVKFDSGKLIGYNTDAYGFITPLKAKFGDLKDARVAVFGAGGAARACVYALKQENADVTLFARNMQKANVFAEEFGVSSKQITSEHQPLIKEFEIVVNATPLGMKGSLENETLLTAAHLKGVKFVYDLVTSRTDTPLIREAKKAQVLAIGGLEMLIHQGAKQFEIWTGQAAPMETMREAVFKRVEQK